jgi:membrane protein involved in colicin uptake
MRVRMKTTSAGPEGVRKQGQIIDVAKDEAEALIAGGYAEQPDEDALGGAEHLSLVAKQKAKAEAKAEAKAKAEADANAQADAEAEAKAKAEAEAKAKAEAEAKGQGDETAQVTPPETAAARTGRAK